MQHRGLRTTRKPDGFSTAQVQRVAVLFSFSFPPLFVVVLASSTALNTFIRIEQKREEMVPVGGLPFG
jgi:hypothetical protein